MVWVVAFQNEVLLTGSTIRLDETHDLRPSEVWQINPKVVRREK
jgi:hypothetical protein